MFSNFYANLKRRCVVAAFAILMALFLTANLTARQTSLEVTAPGESRPLTSAPIQARPTASADKEPEINPTVMGEHSYVDMLQIVQNIPTPVPSPSPTLSAIPSPTPTPTPSPTPSPSPSPSPTPTPTPNPSPKPSPKPSPTPTPTPSPKPSPTPTSYPNGSGIYGSNGYMWPTISTRLTSNFNEERGGGKLHKGVDVGAVVRGVEGDPLFAAQDGTVIRSFMAWSGSGYGGYGNVVVIKHADGNYTLYAHCQKLLVKVGDTVKQGDVIALMGNTGNSTGPHLHFEIRSGDEFGERLNPEAIFDLG